MSPPSPSQPLAPVIIGSSSASASENHATPTFTASTASPTPTPTPPAPPPKPKQHRSCVTCRRRKVRCDKASPCSHCRRANIACVFPSDHDRPPPSWARRLARLTNETTTTTTKAASSSSTTTPGSHPASVMERLRSLEGLVKELSSQLEQARAAAAAAAAGSNAGDSATPPPPDTARDDGGKGGLTSRANAADVPEEQLGRLVLEDANGSCYVSSGFWSRVDDELHGLKMSLAREESDASEESHHLHPQSDPSHQAPTSSIQELDRTPSERHAFFFRHNLSSNQSDGHEFQPLPSQVPFLLETYAESVNLFLQAVHRPTIDKLVRGQRGSRSSVVSPADEALLFSIYYAAVIAMEEDDVITNFGTTKGELSLKYRLGLEHALAKADFLNAPSLTIVQALAIFLALARRHDSPRFVWMMTGVAIRMAQSLGLHRDGSHFPQLTPYEVERRRRAWWALCFLDVRSSEDQGMDYTILPRSFDTKFPLNINDADISPQTRETPPERPGLTDMTLTIDMCKICHLTRRIMDKEHAPTLQDQRRLVAELYETMERGYILLAKDADDIATAWVAVTAIRLTMAKMTLFINFPALFAPHTTAAVTATTATRNTLLAAAIEVAEWNHALNAEPTGRQWRWLYQTYTHWHAVVILLMEIARRPLSPLVERAWLALRSCWLIPAANPQGSSSGRDKKLQIWVPLRKLMATARKHRDAEIDRLRGDAQAVGRVEADEQATVAPASVCPYMSEEELHQHWNSLFTAEAPNMRPQPTGPSFSENSSNMTSAGQQNLASPPRFWGSSLPPQQRDSFAGMSTMDSQSSQGFSGATQNNPLGATTHRTSPPETALSQQEHVSRQSAGTSFAPEPTSWPGLQQFSANAMPWLWADVDPTTEVFGGDLDVNMDSESDWQHWLEFAKNMELDPDGT